jgi:hypothetical protein
MKRWLTLMLVLGLLAAAGCANMTPQQQRALSGGAIGAALAPLLGEAPPWEQPLPAPWGLPPERSGKTSITP